METKPLQQTVERALHLLVEQRGAELVQAVAPIIFTNLDKGRMQTFLERQNCTPADYLQRVADHYEQWHDYVHTVQVERSSDAWQPLYEQLQQWAFWLLPRIGYPAYANREEQLEQAQACAAEAAIVLLNAYFPYDVDFEPWAYVLLQNVSRKEMNRRIKPRLDAQKHEVELDAWDDWLHNLTDPDGEDEQRLAELRVDLLQLVTQLSSEVRQQFILLHYFEEQPFEQIAPQMDRNLNSLYKLHSDALENLRKIWRENRDKYE